MSTLLLQHDLALADSAAAPAHVVRSVSGADPLRLDLPPAPGIQVAPEALRPMSALYFAARLEQAGVLQVAELFVRDRAILRMPMPVAAKLEEMARRQRDWYPLEQRGRIYARLFGIGPAAASEPGGAGARFEPLLAALCSALVYHARRSAYERPGALARAALDLAQVAGSVGTGGLALIVPRLNDQLRRAIDLLSDPQVSAFAGAPGLWGVLRRILEPNVPDFRRLLDCGRHGQRVLRWLADTVALLDRPGMPMPEPPPDVPASALAWLVANGLVSATPGEGLV